MKTLKLLICIMAFALLSFQANAQQVIASAGGYFQSDNLSLSFTLGEPVTATYQNDEIILIQGFQQPYNFYLQQILNIPAGWSGVSTYLNPLNKGVEGMFSTFGNDFIILSAMTDFYYPAAGVNTIGNWNYETGYQIKTANNLELMIAGKKIRNPTLELVQGWNLIPVLNNCNNPVEELFSQITGNLQIVKEVAGTGVYWPQFGVNTLGNIVPGKAYFVLVDEDVELEFFPCTPANSQRTPSNSPLRGRTSQRTGTGQRVGTPSPTGEGWGEVSWGEVIRTPITHTIAIPLQAIAGIAEGSIITIYNQFGLCCGAAIFENQNHALTVFGDDPTTPAIDGMTESEAMIFRIFNPETGNEFVLEVEYDELMPQGGSFVNHGLSAVKSLESTEVEEFAGKQFNISVYPNPSTGIFHVSTFDSPPAGGLSEFNWEISNTHGSIIATGKDETNNFTINLSTHPKGIYYLKIAYEDTQTVKKLVLQ